MSKIISRPCPICREPHFAKDCTLLKNAKCATCGEYGHFTAYHGAHLQFLEKVKKQKEETESKDIWAAALRSATFSIMPGFAQIVDLLKGKVSCFELGNAHSRNAPEEKEKMLEHVTKKCPEISIEDAQQLVHIIHKKHFSEIMMVLHQTVLFDETIEAEYEVMFGYERVDPDQIRAKEQRIAEAAIKKAAASEKREESSDDDDSDDDDELLAEEARLGIVIRC